MLQFVNDNIESMNTEFNFWVSQRTVNVTKHGNHYSLARYDVEVDAPLLAVITSKGFVHQPLVTGGRGIARSHLVGGTATSLYGKTIRAQSPK